MRELWIKLDYTINIWRNRTILILILVFFIVIALVLLTREFRSESKIRNLFVIMWGVSLTLPFTPFLSLFLRLHSTHKKNYTSILLPSRFSIENLNTIVMEYLKSKNYKTRNNKHPIITGITKSYYIYVDGKTEKQSSEYPQTLPPDVVIELLLIKTGGKRNVILSIGSISLKLKKDIKQDIIQRINDL